MGDMWELDFWEMILRVTIAFILLLILARLMGKKQVSQLTIFHYVTGITIGSIAGDIVSKSGTHFLNGLISKLFYDALNNGVTYCLMKSNCEALLMAVTLTGVTSATRVSSLHRRGERLEKSHPQVFR
jgi:uncharacterized membrane protein YcaP (DUF421 family)